MSDKCMDETDNKHNRGRMKGGDYDVIRRNIPYLCGQLSGNDIVDNMFSEGILNRDDEVKVQKQLKKGRPEGIRMLLGFLMESGGVNAFDPFIECLNGAGFSHVADRLKHDRQGTSNAVNVEDTLSNAPSSPSEM